MIEKDENFQLSLFEDKKLLELTPSFEDFYDFTMQDFLNLSLQEVHFRIPDCVYQHLEFVGGELYEYKINKIEVYEKKKIYHIRAYITTKFSEGVSLNEKT